MPILNVKNRSNRLMRYRILAQAVILIVFLGLLWLRRTADAGIGLS